jgi:PPM family protein phosphatase
VRHIRVLAFTDVGLRRKRNEDAVLVAGWVCQTHDGALVTMDFEPTDPFVCVVADGMGGHAGGNVASRSALNVIAERSPGWRTVDDVAATIAYANDQVRGIGAENELEGLGTTVAGLCVTGDEIIVFNVGDSRVYSVTGGRPQQLSRDDAVLDAAGNPTNVITQSLGQPGSVQTHVTTLPLQPGTYLLCSDGVSGMMNEADLSAAFGVGDLSDVAANIVATTRSKGAEDNFSFIIVAVPDLGSEDTHPRGFRAATAARAPRAVPPLRPPMGRPHERRQPPLAQPPSAPPPPHRAPRSPRRPRPPAGHFQ